MTAPLFSSVAASDGATIQVMVRRNSARRHGLLLVHGFAANGHLWDGVADALATDGYASAAPDLRGHGRSNHVDAGFDVGTMVADLAVVLDATLPTPAIAVGHSLGGHLVLQLAAAHPALVAGVVLVDGGFMRLDEVFRDSDAALDRLTLPSLDGMAMSDLEDGASLWFDGFPQSGITAELASFEESPDGTVRPRLALDAQSALLRSMWEHNPHELAPQIAQPVLVIATSGGFAGGRGPADRFASRCRNGSVVWLEGHHDIHAQQPRQVARTLATFASELARNH